MAGQYIVRSDRQVLVINEQLSERDLRFAQGPDGGIDPRYALEVAIELMSKPAPPAEPIEAPSRTFFSWLPWKRPALLGGTV
jgi:hypothetical protein